MEDICKSILWTLEWRQNFYPFARMSDPLLSLLKHGLFYIHGRTKNYCPIMIINFTKLGQLLKSKELNNFNFCSLHNFYAMYMEKNMLIPGQIEKWIVINNLGKFPLKEMPIGMFKASNKDLAGNFIDRSSKQIIVNMTWG